MQNILGRRSIRKYHPQPIEPEKVRRLLEAAMAAPSAGNQQPWHFVVIDDREVLDRAGEIHQYWAMCKEAPLAILVCADVELEKHQGFWVQDCSAATENLLLAAHSLGLGAVWLGVHPRSERVLGIKQLLGLPDSVIPLSLVPIGHPAEQKPPSERYDQSRVHSNHW